MKRSRQEPTMPGTVIDHRGITLSAGVAAFDEALVTRFKEIAAQATAGREHIKSETLGEAGPAVNELPLPDRYPHRDDDAV
jgi:hypothetical protein